jgi:NADPH:quinone reductase-like Zn-dependent oxidoreductase
VGELPEPSRAALARLTLDLVGLRERRPGDAAVAEYALLRVRAAALAWSDVTMATGEYPARVPRPLSRGKRACARRLRGAASDVIIDRGCRTLVGCCMGSGYGERLPGIEQATRDHRLSLLATGRFRPSVSRVVGSEEILRDLAERRTIGRIVARIAV